MPQPPFKTDVLQIEPGSGDTLTISRDSTDGSLRFVDAVITGGVTLKELVSTKNITGLATVGAGEGAEYATIQEAIDATTATPAVVLINPGTYSENIKIEKDGLYLVGVGAVTLTNAVDEPTVAINGNLTTTPTLCRLQNLRIENTAIAGNCVRIIGAVYAEGTATVNTAPLAAGDTLTIGGTTLTGVGGTRTSGLNDFAVNGLTVDAVATEIAAALNDGANAFTGLVTATVVAGVITLRAIAPGTGGNATTLVAVTTPAGGITVSAATLAGGTDGSGTTVGSDRIEIIDCDLIASGVGGFQVFSSVANFIRVQGGTWRGSASTSSAFVTQTAAFRCFGVEYVNNLDFSYDSGGTIPSDITNVYQVENCGAVGTILTNLIGVGSLELADLPSTGTLTFGGDRSFTATHCRLGTLLLSDTVAVKLIECSRGAATTAAGTPTLEESVFTGSVTWPGAAAVPFAFSVLQPDLLYSVHMESPGVGLVPTITAKTTASFTASSTAASVATTFFTVMRQVV